MLLYDFYSNDTRQVYHICPLMMSGEFATVDSRNFFSKCVEESRCWC